MVLIIPWAIDVGEFVIIPRPAAYVPVPPLQAYEEPDWIQQHAQALLPVPKPRKATRTRYLSGIDRLSREGAHLARRVRVVGQGHWPVFDAAEGEISPRRFMTNWMPSATGSRQEKIR